MSGREIPARGGFRSRAVVSDAPRVTVYHASDCSLCARALEVVGKLQRELGFPLDLVDIGGDPALEERYRPLLPAIEIDGELAFTYFVDADALRARLSGR
jgi:hypothetical protein